MVGQHCKLQTMPACQTMTQHHFDSRIAHRHLTQHKIMWGDASPYGWHAAACLHAGLN